MKKYYILITLVFVFIFIASPIMKVKTVEVNGLDNFSQYDILEMAQFQENINIFAFSKARASENIEKNTYIKSVEIEKDFLNRKLIFNVIERHLSGYVKFNENNYLFVDKDGFVLECRTSFAQKRPVIEGLEFSEFSVGDYLKVENTKAFNVMVSLSHLFEKFEVEHDIVRVDLSKENDIHFYYGHIDILFGDSSDLDLKIRTMKEILPNLEQEKDSGGFLYLQDPQNPRYSILS